MPSRAGNRAALVAMTILASLAAAEVATRLLLPQPDFESVSDHPSIVPHPTRGYAYAPNYPGFSNALGMRDDPIGPGERVDVLAVGDSFTVGGGLKAEDAWPRQLQVLLNETTGHAMPIRVANAGVAAYSVTQIRVATGELAATLRPTVIVLGLLTSRYWRIADPYVYFHGVAVRTGEVPYLHRTRKGIVRSPFTGRLTTSVDVFFAEHFYFGAHLARAVRSRLLGAGDAVSSGPARPLADRLEPLLQEVEEIQRIAAGAGSRLLILLINEQNEDGTFSAIEKDYNAAVTSHAAKLGIPVVDPLPALEAAAGGKPVFRQGSDYHWSASAQRVAAEQLAKRFFEERVLR